MNKKLKKKNVLDKGYVLLVDSFGSDLSVVNAARVSYDKSSDEITDRDARLINYLVKHKHDSVLRHCAVTFEVYAPLFVARQWWKHHVSSTSVDDQNGWNESSRRYITEEPEFYVPEHWRSAPENSKQGSGGPVGDGINKLHTELYTYFIDTSVDAYKRALEDGIAVEQARLYLPAYGMYVRWRWTASLNALLHFAHLRKAGGAQKEINDYADVVNDIVEELFPLTTAAWKEHRL